MDSARRTRLADDATSLLFVYGTLLFAPILQVLLGRVPEGEPATVTGWRRAALAGATYPVLVAAPGQQTDGMLLAGLSESEWAVLDAYEDDLYELATVVTLAGRTALAYASPPGSRSGLLETDWDPDGFARLHLAGFAAAVRRWREDL